MSPLVACHPIDGGAGKKIELTLAKMVHRNVSGTGWARLRAYAVGGLSILCRYWNYCLVSANVTILGLTEVAGLLYVDPARFSNLVLGPVAHVERNSLLVVDCDFFA